MRCCLCTGFKELLLIHCLAFNCWPFGNKYFKKRDGTFVLLKFSKCVSNYSNFCLCVCLFAIMPFRPALSEIFINSPKCAQIYCLNPIGFLITCSFFFNFLSWCKIEWWFLVKNTMHILWDHIFNLIGSLTKITKKWRCTTRIQVTLKHRHDQTNALNCVTIVFVRVGRPAELWEY